MTRQFISKTHFLNPVALDVEPFNISHTTFGLIEHVADSMSRKCVLEVISELYKRHVRPYRDSVEIKQLQIVEERPLATIAPTRRDYSKRHYDLLMSKRADFIQYIDTVLAGLQSLPPAVKVLGIDNRYSMQSPSTAIKELSELKASVLSLPERTIDLKGYTFREHVRNDIDSARLYYAIIDDKFLCLAKSREKNATNYRWAFTRNRAEAYLFTGELAAYAIPSPERVNRLFVSVNLTSLEINERSDMVEKLAVQLEKRDIEGVIPERQETKKYKL